MKINVLVVYPYYPHYRLPVMKELSKDIDITYTFISGKTTDFNIKTITETEYQANDIRWIEVKNCWLFNRRILWQIGVIRECLSGKYDIVILHPIPYVISNWIAVFLLKFSKRPLFFWAHGIVRNNRRDKIKMFLYRLPDGLLLYGNWAKNRLIGLGVNPKKIHVIYNSLNYEEQLAIREKISDNELIVLKEKLFKFHEKPIIVFVGRLTSRKKLYLLIEAMRKLHTKDEKINLLIIGDGEDRSTLEDLVRNYDLMDYVCFYGETYNEYEIAYLLALSAICVSPGDVGLTAMHAMVYGTPVITHNDPYTQMPEFEAVIPGETGMFFEPDSVESLATTIKAWLENNQNNRKEISQNCYKIIDKFYNPKYQAEAIKRALSSVITQ